MHRTSRRTSPALILALAMALTAGGRGAVAAPRDAATSRTPNAPRCPSLAEIETAIGYPVKSHPVPIDGCMYELTGQYQGVFITLSYQPATRAEDVYVGIRKGVKGAKGMNAQPDRLSLGEGGWGYGSRGQQEAAAVSQGRLYHVEMDFDLFDSMNMREDAAVRVIALAMRTAGPAAASTAAGKSAAALDACTLATNAEMGQVGEERAELVKYWDAPTASYGGSHCDYGNGSIRVYEGKSAAANFEGMLKALKADKQPRIPVAGIGDKAFFMIPIPNNKYQRLGLLAVYAGPRVLQLILDANGEEPIEATRPRLERLARLVLPRLH
jgi:hypothetical protein